MTKTHSPKTLFALAFGALGVVYGDIGTSPLYTVRQIFFGLGGVKPTGPNIIGAISTVLWVLTLVVTIKYIIFVLRAEYEKEGGLFALLGHLRNITAPGVASVSVLLILGAGLLIGDGVITPAISVLSAVEGVGVLAPSMMGYVVPVTLLIQVGEQRFAPGDRQDHGAQHEHRAKRAHPPQEDQSMPGISGCPG
jgi:KUP system potassium uptake protein